MFTLTKEFKFEAAHRLPHHDGKCQRLHGHSFRMRVVLRGPRLVEDGPKRGMLRDFGDVKAAVAPLVDGVLDHHYLNETLPDIESPTSEAVAKWVYDQVKPFLPELLAVEIDETCTSSARYEGGAS